MTLSDVTSFSYTGITGYSFVCDLLADGVNNLADIPVLARSIGARCP